MLVLFAKKTRLLFFYCFDGTFFLVSNDFCILLQGLAIVGGEDGSCDIDSARKQYAVVGGEVPRLGKVVRTVVGGECELANIATLYVIYIDRGRGNAAGQVVFHAKCGVVMCGIGCGNELSDLGSSVVCHAEADGGIAGVVEDIPAFEG